MLGAALVSLGIPRVGYQGCGGCRSQSAIELITLLSQLCISRGSEERSSFLAIQFWVLLVEYLGLGARDLLLVRLIDESAV